jgi:hypothetical protein
MENKVAVNPEFLNTWKEIANYMGMGVRTVQRYEELYGLPVRRINGRRSGRGNHSPVISTRSEIDAWFTARGAKGDKLLLKLEAHSGKSIGNGAKPATSVTCLLIGTEGEIVSGTKGQKCRVLHSQGFFARHCRLKTCERSESGG